MVAEVGFEPTDLLVMSQSSFLIAPLRNVVGMVGFEPTTPGTQNQCAGQAALHPVGEGRGI